MWKFHDEWWVIIRNHGFDIFWHYFVLRFLLLFSVNTFSNVWKSLAAHAKKSLTVIVEIDQILFER